MFNKKRMDKQILGSAYHKYYDFKCLQNLVNNLPNLLKKRHKIHEELRIASGIHSPRLLDLCQLAHLLMKPGYAKTWLVKAR